MFLPTLYLKQLVNYSYQRWKMNLIEYVNLDEIHTLWTEDVQSLIADLSTKSHSDIPEEKKERVADFLVAVLNAGAVARTMIQSIEKLLQDLQRSK